MMVLQENDLPRVVVSLDTLYVRHKKEIGIPPHTVSKVQYLYKNSSWRKHLKNSQLGDFYGQIEQIDYLLCSRILAQKKSLLFGKNYTFNIVWICVYC